MQKTEDEYHRNERTQNCANRAPRKERWPSRRRLYRYETVNMKMARSTESAMYENCMYMNS